MFVVTATYNATWTRLLCSLICNNFLGTYSNPAETDALGELSVLISTLRNFIDVSFP